MADPADEEFQRALSALKAGKAAEAERLLKAVLRAQPKNVTVLNLLGVALGRLGRNADAVESFDQALALAPNSVESWFGRGMTLVAANRHQDAIASFDRAIAAKPDFVQVHLLRAKLLTDLRRHDDALAGVDKLLAIAADVAEAWLGRSNILFALKRYEEALAACERALALKPDLAEAWHGRGNALNEIGRYDDALAAYGRALAINPQSAAAWHGRGSVLIEIKHHGEALVAFNRALALMPTFAEAWLGRGNVLSELGRYDEALDDFNQALAQRADLAEACVGRGNIFFRLKQYDGAFAAYERARSLAPGLAGAWLGCGNVFTDVKQYENALAAYDRALETKPQLAEAWFGRGNVFFDLKKYDDALVAYDRALALKPGLDFLAGARLSSKQYICDWTDLEADFTRVLDAIRDGKLASAPYIILATPSSPREQLQCVTAYIQHQPIFPPMWRGEIHAHDRVRVAYLSADMGEHAIGYLTVGLFECHDRSRFEFTCLSFGPDQDSDTRRRIKNAFERFVDVREKSDQEIAELMHALEIDIAVDLMGFTRNSRFNVLARRAAPVQVSFIGFAGTMGAPWIDYIIADRTTIPSQDLGFYSEQVVWLPDSYYVNDSRRTIAETIPSRTECALPDGAFVFCCFNNTFKITPQSFDIWMRLLKSVEGSVLWLIEGNETASANLRREAEKRGVAPERLVFAGRTKPDVHLARHKHADLFLDTLPYNAHTTACDALWAGVPVVTCQGKSFAGRVAASVLKAVGLDELITTSLEDYEARALTLARDRASLAAIKSKLARNRDAYPLFDTERFARNIEKAYMEMWERYQKGEGRRADGTEPMCIN